MELITDVIRENWRLTASSVSSLSFGINYLLLRFRCWCEFWHRPQMSAIWAGRGACCEGLVSAIVCLKIIRGRTAPPALNNIMPVGDVDYNGANTVFCQKGYCISGLSDCVKLKAGKGEEKEKAGEPRLAVSVWQPVQHSVVHHHQPRCYLSLFPSLVPRSISSKICGSLDSGSQRNVVQMPFRYL